ncbi:MAG TPA: LLM class flavin-dependent oxidoreductase [Candidatus Dormibacteraeota bacterium]|nr:LLM class flavin-dependent oxidoreductase [Candidatus Dormibacteraeota bacterium]
MSRPEFGIGLQGDRPVSEYGALGRLAEDLGFDVVTAFGDAGYLPPLVVLMQVAAATSRVRLGPSCLNPYTTHPVEMASQIAALAQASGGRAYLGLAKGAWLDSIGVAQPRPVRKLREAAAVVDLLLRGDEVGYRGEVFTVAPGFRLLQPLPARRVPLLIGAWGPRTVALAGEIADELKVGGSANPDLVAVMRERLGNGSTPIVFGAVTVVDHDGRAARERARQAVAMYFDVVGRHDPTVDVANGLTEDLLDRFVLAGTPKEIARQVRRLVDAGVARVEFGAPFGLDLMGGLELLGREVLPEFS